MLTLNFIALKRLQSELETTNDKIVEPVEEVEEILSSTKTTSPSLKKSPKSSDFGKSIRLFFFFYLHLTNF